MGYLITFISMASQILTLLVIAQVLLSYFMSPYHPVRQTIDSIVEPMMAPIRRFVPPMGMIDFSPLVLILLIQLAARLLIGVLVAL